MHELLRRELSSWGGMLRRDKGVTLAWDEEVVNWLASKVHLIGAFGGGIC